MKLKMIFTSCLVAIAVMLWLSNTIKGREAERVAINQSPQINPEDTSKSEEFARYYPRQYSSWAKTKDSDTIDDMLKIKPQLSVLWAGYGFSKDYNAPRGHRYALTDNINTLRTGAPTDEKTGPMPTACWTCKSPDVPRLIERDGEKEFFSGKWAKYGNEVTNTIGCADCHDPKTMELQVRRPFLDRALKEAGLPTFADSTHQEKRTLVCAQCHNEYYFKKTEFKDFNGNTKKAAVVTLPWANGLGALDAEKYYDERNFKDWTHKISKTPMLKAQHPGYEMFKTSVHGQKGVSCADCHMPYTQEGAVKYSDHQVGNPLDTMDRSCMVCHRESEEKLRSFVHQKKERKEYLMDLAMDNLAKAHLEAGKAWELGATKEEMQPVLMDIRHGQWRWDYSIASHASYFHAPGETLKLLGMANELAMQARLKLVKILAKRGAVDYMAPDFSSKEKAQKLAGVDLAKLVAAKINFKKTLEEAWKKQAIEKGALNPKSREGLNETKSSYQN